MHLGLVLIKLFEKHINNTVHYYALDLTNGSIQRPTVSGANRKSGKKIKSIASFGTIGSSRSSPGPLWRALSMILAVAKIRAENHQM